MKPQPQHVQDLRDPKVLLLWLAARNALDKIEEAVNNIVTGKIPNQKRHA